jgi:hypothetical protein
MISTKSKAILFQIIVQIENRLDSGTTRFPLGKRVHGREPTTIEETETFCKEIRNEILFESENA